MAGPARSLSGGRGASDRPAPVENPRRGDAVALFDVIQRPRPAPRSPPRWARRSPAPARAGARLPRLFVQVNTGDEPQKGGVSPAEFECLPRRLPATRTVSTIEGPDVHPPRRRPALPAFRLLGEIARRKRGAGALHGHERGLRGRGAAGGDVCAGWERDLRGAGVARRVADAPFVQDAPALAGIGISPMNVASPAVAPRSRPDRGGETWRALAGPTLQRARLPARDLFRPPRPTPATPHETFADRSRSRGLRDVLLPRRAALRLGGLRLRRLSGRAARRRAVWRAFRVPHALSGPRARLLHRGGRLRAAGRPGRPGSGSRSSPIRCSRPNSPQLTSRAVRGQRGERARDRQAAWRPSSPGSSPAPAIFGGPPPATREGRAVARAREMIDACFAEDLGLAEIADEVAAIAGASVSRLQGRERVFFAATPTRSIGAFAPPVACWRRARGRRRWRSTSASMTRAIFNRVFQGPHGRHARGVRVERTFVQDRRGLSRYERATSTASELRP